MKNKSWFRADIIGAVLGLLVGLVIGLIGQAFNTPVVAIGIVSGVAAGFVVAKILPMLRLGESMAKFTVRFFGGGGGFQPGPPRIKVPVSGAHHHHHEPKVTKPKGHKVNIE